MTTNEVARPRTQTETTRSSKKKAKSGANVEVTNATIIILNWNSGDYLAECLRSVFSTIRSRVKVVVVDNASTDSSLEIAQQYLSQIVLIRNQTNLGFAAAYNRAIFQMSEDFAILLNPDTQVDSSGWVERLVSVAQRDDRNGAVACKLVFADNPKLINSVGGMAYWWTGIVDIGFGEADRGQYGHNFEPFSASGGAMLVRRRSFLEVGGFDEAMFAYIEDFDLCWRMRLKALRIGFAPDVVVKHALSTSTGRLSPFKFYLSHRNYLRAMLRNFSAQTLVVALPAYLLWTWVKALGALFAERSLELSSAPLRAVAWNLLVLPDTLMERRKIQSSRIVKESEIIRKMGPRGFEPLSALTKRWTIAKRE